MHRLDPQDHHFNISFGRLGASLGAGFQLSDFCVSLCNALDNLQLGLGLGRGNPLTTFALGIGERQI
jgi:hypothetical protein